MIIHYIESELASYGFEKEKKNTGYVYKSICGNIELICYVEEKIKLYFVSVYKWSNNRIKGAYHISLEELKKNPDFSLILFKKTMQYMPQYLGTEVNIHAEIEKAIDEVFNNKI